MSLYEAMVLRTRAGDNPSTVIEQTMITREMLNPAIWDEDKQMHIAVKNVLNEIAQDFYEELEIQAPLMDVQLTGSNANYNWTEYSDVDVHLLIDFNDVDDDVELVKKAMDNIRWRWNTQHAPSIKGHEIEVYVQDIHEPHIASGLYSLKKDEWLIVPEVKAVSIDIRDVEQKARRFKDKIDEIVKIEDPIQRHDEMGAIRDRIRDMRKSGLQTGGEFSVENLAFKELRNSGYIATLIDGMNKAYDAAHSVEGATGSNLSGSIKDDENAYENIDNPTRELYSGAR